MQGEERAVKLSPGQVIALALINSEQQCPLHNISPAKIPAHERGGVLRPHLYLTADSAGGENHSLLNVWPLIDSSHTSDGPMPVP